MCAMKLSPEDIRKKIEEAQWYEVEMLWIPKIMQWQTDDEKVDRTTKHQNGAGLNACDAGKISWYSNLISKGYHLNTEQLDDAKKRLIKYRKQYSESTA